MKIIACLLGTVLLAVSAVAGAATEQEIRQAFEKAQKKGAVAVYKESCGGFDSVYFPGAGVAKTVAAMSALVALQQRAGTTGCPAGMQPGDSRILELYPDGTVKPE